MDPSTLRRHIVEVIRLCETTLPSDVKKRLREAYESEHREIPRRILGILLENVEVAEKESRPICQDTGTLTFYVKRGGYDEKELRRVITEAVREASETIPLRPNTIDFVTGRNTGDNVGIFSPWIVWEPGENLEITVVAKGGGSEAISGLRIMPATAGRRDIFKAILESVAQAGARPCPPIILGVGIASLPEVALSIAKKAIYLRRLGERHVDEAISMMETELLNKVNELDIGVHGFSGLTALDVHVEHASIHPSSMALGIIASCWALRRASLRVFKDTVKIGDF
ncbi:MAG: fumarate hydratase [Thermoproteota archaeon]